MDRHHLRATAQRGDLGDTPQAGHGEPRDTGRLDGERYDRNQRITVFLGHGCRASCPGCEVLTKALKEEASEEERVRKRPHDQRSKIGLVAVKRLGTTLPWLKAAFYSPEDQA